MVKSGVVLHHQHVRKRIHKKFEIYPHPDKWKNLMDKLIYIVGVIGPIMTIPQLMNVWVDKNISGVSAITFATYFITSIFWISYGIMHKEKPIIFIYGCWLIIHFLIVLGILLHG